MKQGDNMTSDRSHARNRRRDRIGTLASVLGLLLLPACGSEGPLGYSAQATSAGEVLNTSLMIGTCRG